MTGNGSGWNKTISIDCSEDYGNYSSEEKKYQPNTRIQRYLTLGSCSAAPIDLDDDDDDGDDDDEQDLRMALSLSTPGRQAVGYTPDNLALFLNNGLDVQPAASCLQGGPISNIDDLRGVVREQFPLGLPRATSSAPAHVPIAQDGARLVRLSALSLQLDKPPLPIARHPRTLTPALGILRGYATQQHHRQIHLPPPHTPPPTQLVPPAPRPAPAPPTIPTSAMTINAGCIICLETISNTVLFPCRHLAMCEVCFPCPLSV